MTESIYAATHAYISENSKLRISISEVLNHLGVSKSGYYSWINRTPSRQIRLKQNVKTAIRKIYDGSKQIYGAPKVTKELHKQGFQTTERTVTTYIPTRKDFVYLSCIMDLFSRKIVA